MRPFGLGLLAALMVALAAPAMALAAPAKAPEVKIDPNARKKGMADAPALLQAAGVTCQLSDARFVGAAPADKKTGSLGSSLYEVACGQGGMGYLVQTSGTGGAPNLFSCIEANTVDPTSGKAANPCQLPGNTDSAALIAPFLAKAKVNCPVDKVRGIGQTKANTLIEVECTGGTGYILMASAPLDASKDVQANNCLAYDAAQGGNIKCILAEPAARLAVVDTYAKSSSTPCQVKDKRFVGQFTDGTEGYEVSCADGKGLIFKVNAQGQVAQTLDCKNVSPGTCTLTDTRAALAEQAGLYTKLAKNSGSNCNVERYAVFPAKGSDEVVELVCTGGAGAIGMFPASGKGRVLDCGHALLAGYRCSLGKADYTAITDDLKKFDKKDCQVSQVGQPLKGADGSMRLEVACADGLPGYMITYSDPQTPKEAIGCGFAGNCTLPTNKKKG
jgi:hypothetical protein